MPAVVFTPPAPIPAQLPARTAGASASTRLADSALPGVASARTAGVAVSTELKQPIEQLRAAIESRLPGRIEDVYKSYDQDDATKKYLRGIIDKADSVHIKSVFYQNSSVKGNTAQLNFRMIMNVTFNASKIPTEVPSTWRADLTRDGQRSAWQIQHLMKHGF
jgi:hypothetical protein